VRTDDLFNTLDLDADGELWCDDLRRAAKLLGWHWQQAPLFGVLHALTLRQPLRRDDFAPCLREMADDEHVEEMLSAAVRVLPGAGDVGSNLGGAA
jgi:hypothetical protein